MKKRNQNALLLVGSIILSLIIGELVAQNFETHLCKKIKEKNKNNFLTLFPDLRGITEIDELDGYRPRPNASVEVFGECFRTDSLGCRTGLPAPDSAHIILFIGDSMVFGVGLVDSLTPPSQIQRALNTRTPEHPCQVINGGVMGYSFLNYLHETERLAPKIRPDLILIGLCFNDEYTNNDPYNNIQEVLHRQATKEEISAKQKRLQRKNSGMTYIHNTWPREIISCLRGRSALVRFCEYVYKKRRDASTKKEIGNEIKIISPTRMNSIVSDYVGQLNGYGVPYAFIYFPTARPEKRLPYVRILQERDLPLLDLTKSPKFNPELFFIKDWEFRNKVNSYVSDIHLNANGSKIFADLVSDWLVEKELW
jgi:lysophospholipase L1-like esterase